MRPAALHYSFVLAALITLCGCSTTPDSQSEKDKFHTDTTDSMNAFYKDDATLQTLVNKSYGYAIYPSIIKGALGVGGAYGKGKCTRTDS